jgi:hypothetical protein
MTKKLTLLSICLFLIATITYTAFSQGKEKNNKKESHGNGHDKKNKEQDNDNDKDENKDNKKDHEENKENNKDHVKGQEKHDNEGKHDRTDMNDSYHWTKENFKDREKLSKQDKVTICHKLNGNQQGVTLSVSANAVKAHMNHGDIMGECPQVNNSGYSSTFIQQQTNYYNVIQSTHEQVIYSKSVLDYALERLAASRIQLVTMQASNMPVAQIQDKQTAVVELEQNVSLLQTLLGVAINFVAGKL